MVTPEVPKLTYIRIDDAAWLRHLCDIEDKNCPPQNRETTMRKFIISAVAAASLFGLASAANAGIWMPGPFGPVYVPTCVWTVYGNVCG